MRRPFLTAEWRNLALVNYEVDPKLLEAKVPSGVELDFYDDKCFVSLVAFQFLNTKVKGVAIPGHVNFVEVNLRFYVRRGDKRGVVFIKEFVPKPAIAWVARVVYGEPYEVWGCRVEGTDYRWNRGKKEFRMALDPEETGNLPEPGSHAEFITEHYWGYTRRDGSRTDEYQVTHPQWEHFGLRSHSVEVDFAEVYGPEWEFLNQAEPFSVLFARGSEIEVFSAGRIA